MGTSVSEEHTSVGTKELNENNALISPEDYTMFCRKVDTRLPAVMTRIPQC
jgi:hypothetical protein